jgi:SPFH domain / Band 7 family
LNAHRKDDVVFPAYFKGEPSVHVIRYRRGGVVAQGSGLAFWYLRYNTSIAMVPIVAQDAPFIFNEATRDFQVVAIQGSLLYRITAPLVAARAVNYAIDPRTGRYRSDDPAKLGQRLINVVQGHTRSQVIDLPLEQAMTKVKDLAADVLARIQGEPLLASLGVAVEGLHFAGVSATPEMRKALEADYREALQQRADQAIYARRAKAIEEERRIKQREMDTEVELENQKKALVEMQANNRVTQAQAEAKAEELKLAAYAQLAPQQLMSLAFKEWAAGGGKIGNVTVTPDMLGQIGNWMAGAKK